MDHDDRRSAARADLARPQFAPLWSVARRRLEGNGGQITKSPLDLGDLTNEQVDAISGLLGLPPPTGRAVKVRPDVLDAELRRGAAELGLVDLLVELSGPLRDRRAEKASDRRHREQVWGDAAAHEAVARHPALVDWLATLKRSGSATRLAGGADSLGSLLDDALAVLSRMPADPVVALATLADETTGDPHALDRGRPLGTLVPGALPLIATQRAEDDDEPEPTWATTRGEVEAGRAVAWRRTWASVGVQCDDLSVSALVLNLPVRSSSDLVANTIYEHGMFGEPLRLTLRQVATSDLVMVDGTVTHICENPVVVAQAATLLGREASPLVCVEGVPNSAVAAVLDLLMASGCPLRYHGDFDWPGVAIANDVIARWRAEPWRLSAAAYRAAAPRARKPLTGPVETARWDPELTAAMAEADVAVHEEQVLDDLLTDLRSG